MKKKISKICIVISVLLVIAFIVSSVIDYINYNPMSTSAPYYAGVLVNALVLLIPAIILYIVGVIVKKDIR